MLTMVRVAPHHNTEYLPVSGEETFVSLKPEYETAISDFTDRQF